MPPTNQSSSPVVNHDPQTYNTRLNGAERNLKPNFIISSDHTPPIITHHLEYYWLFYQYKVLRIYQECPLSLTDQLHFLGMLVRKAYHLDTPSWSDTQSSPDPLGIKPNSRILTMTGPNARQTWSWTVTKTAMREICSLHISLSSYLNLTSLHAPLTASEEG